MFEQENKPKSELWSAATSREPEPQLEDESAAAAGSDLFAGGVGQAPGTKPVIDPAMYGLDDDHVQATAERGVAATPAGRVPHAERIQASFGPAHDVRNIQAHVGGNSASAMGATAFATGNHVVFDCSPDLHTAAHEAAHVVQQAQGVNTYGGTGAHEAHADAVADRVVSGQSAADLLGGPTNGAKASGGVVQFKKATPEEATAGDRKGQHETAMQASFDGVRTSLMLLAKRMKASERKLDDIRVHFSGPGGDSQKADMLEAEYDLIRDDVDWLWRGGIPEFDDVYKTQLHHELAILDGVFPGFQAAIHRTANFGYDKNIAMKIRRDEIQQMLDGIHSKLGTKVGDVTPNYDLPKESEDALRSDAITQNLDAAYQNARAGRMDSYSDQKQLGTEIHSATGFIRQAIAQLKAADAKTFKAHKTQIAKVVTEVHELEKSGKSNQAIAETYHELQRVTDELAHLKQ